jgi:hypothetical protein
MAKPEAFDSRNTGQVKEPQSGVRMQLRAQALGEEVDEEQAPEGRKIDHCLHQRCAYVLMK